ERAGQGGTSTRGARDADTSDPRRHLSDRAATATAQDHDKRAINRSGSAAGGVGGKRPGAKSGIRGAGYPAGSNPIGSLYDRLGSRTVTGHFTLPTGRVGQALALTVLGLLLAAGYLAVVAPVLDLYAAREATLADRRMLAQRLGGVADELPSLQTRV